MPFHFENKPSLVVYVTCGDPDLATTRDVVLAAIDAGTAFLYAPGEKPSKLADKLFSKKAEAELQRLLKGEITIHTPWGLRIERLCETALVSGSSGRTRS